MTPNGEDKTATRESRTAAGADLGFQVSRLSKLLRGAIEDELEALGLTATQAALLLNMDAGEQAPIGEVALRLGVDRPTMSGLVDRLVRSGWISTEPNPDDGRSKLLRLEPKAVDAKPQLAAASHRVSARALGGLDPSEAKALISALERAATNLTAHDQQP